jgi:CheY-like chemotaxis protein
MDVGLPTDQGMLNGYELTKQIRSNKSARVSKIPIIGLTAHVDYEHKKLCLDSGMNAVLSKPLTPLTAENLLNAFIPNRNQQESQRILGLTNGLAKPDFLKLEGKIFNFEQALLVHDQDKGCVTEGVQIIVQNLEQELAKLEQAYQLDEPDWATISDIAHDLKGVTSYFGMERVEQAAARLEHCIKLGSHELIAPLYHLLCQEIRLLQKLSF